MTAVVSIDGSTGEGGGQILRTSLALSIITGWPIHIRRIRAGRAKPGLLRQHLTAVLAAEQISSAKVNGARLGSGELWFTPQAVRPGDYQFSIGSAGSTTLVLQTVLPALLTAASRTTLVLEGGTHNIHAPPFEFLQSSFAPLVNRMGPRLSLVLERHGFYPAGGGRLIVKIDPASELKPLEIVDRGPIRSQQATAVVAGLPRTIGERELAVVAAQMGWPAESLEVRHLPSGHGQGNVLLLKVESDALTEVFTGFGQRGIPAEVVAAGVAAEASKYLASDVAVGEHLADQLLLPLALAGGGSFTTLPLSSHAQTNIDVIKTFLDIEVRLTEPWPCARLVQIG